MPTSSSCQGFSDTANDANIAWPTSNSTSTSTSTPPPFLPPYPFLPPAPYGLAASPIWWSTFTAHGWQKMAAARVWWPGTEAEYWVPTARDADGLSDPTAPPLASALTSAQHHRHDSAALVLAVLVACPALVTNFLAHSQRQVCALGHPLRRRACACDSSTSRQSRCRVPCAAPSGPGTSDPAQQLYLGLPAHLPTCPPSLPPSLRCIPETLKQPRTTPTMGRTSNTWVL